MATFLGRKIVNCCENSLLWIAADRVHWRIGVLGNHVLEFPSWQHAALVVRVG